MRPFFQFAASSTVCQTCLPKLLHHLFQVRSDLLRVIRFFRLVHEDCIGHLMSLDGDMIRIRRAISSQSLSLYSRSNFSSAGRAPRCCPAGGLKAPRCGTLTPIRHPDVEDHRGFQDGLGQMLEGRPKPRARIRARIPEWPSADRDLSHGAQEFAVVQADALDQQVH